MHQKKLNWTQRGRLWLRLCIRLIGTGVVLALIGHFGAALLSLFMPFLLALAVAAVLDPTVRLLQRRLGWSRKVIALLVILVLCGGIGTALALLVRAGVMELISLAENWDSLLAALRALMEQTEQFLQGVMARLPFQFQMPDRPVLEGLGSLIGQWLETAALDMGNLTVFATGRVKDATAFVLALVVFLMASYFLCADYPYLKTGLIQRMDDILLGWGRQVKQAALGAFGGYLKAQVLLSVGVFFILLIGFFVTGQSYALLLALGFALLDFIPLFGSGTVMVPWAIIDLFTGRYSQAVALMIIWGLVALFRRVAEPKIVGDQTGLSPILSLISIYIGMRLAGVGGMILGPIVTLVIMNLAGLGLFDGVRADLRLAFEDILAVLRESRQPKE